MWIKICANTNLADAQLAAAQGVDAVGFVFAPSKRQVTAGQVAQITEQLPADVEKVGVFSTTDADEIARIVVSAGLTAAQLHGGFHAGTVRSLAARFGDALKLIQTVAYSTDAPDRAAADRVFEAALEEAFDEPAIWAVLIDAAKSGASGGLGVAFDWAHAAEVLGRVADGRQAGDGVRPRVILAGGLRAENVANAIAVLGPWGVDVASGVEAAPGRKDPERLRRFVAAVR